MKFLKIKFWICCWVIVLIYGGAVHALPAGFVYLKKMDPTIIQEMKYTSDDNFVGRKIKGYEKPNCIVTTKVALALSKIQTELRSKGLGLKVFDCYRPTQAVEDFIAWSRDIHDQKQKQEYFPLVNKADFFELGYVASKSGHSRGSTVDLTLIDLKKNPPTELDMGTHFDFMDERSHPLNPNLPEFFKQKRIFLRTIMLNAGFIPLETEWWHFTLKDEPFPDTYFNFPVA